MNDEFQNPRCATATLSVSADALPPAVAAIMPSRNAIVLRMA
jgi:hypothetical protein